MTNVTLPVSLRRIKKKNEKKSFRGIDKIKRFIDIQSLGVRLRCTDCNYNYCRLCRK